METKLGSTSKTCDKRDRQPLNFDLRIEPWIIGWFCHEFFKKKCMKLVINWKNIKYIHSFKLIPTLPAIWGLKIEADCKSRFWRQNSEPAANQPFLRGCQSIKIWILHKSNGRLPHMTILIKNCSGLKINDLLMDLDDLNGKLQYNFVTNSMRVIPRPSKTSKYLKLTKFLSNNQFFKATLRYHFILHVHF